MNKTKIIKISTILLFLFLQLALLYTIVYENRASIWVFITISIIGIMVLIGYTKLPLHHHDHLYEKFLVTLWVPVGALCTYFLNVDTGLGPVLAASGFGLAASFIPHLNKKSEYLKSLPPALYCGAFVGMSGTNVASSLAFIITASIITAIFLSLSKSLFTGVGGKLGTLAFGGVALTSFIFFLLSQ
ncbi:hypothetical protein NBRC110019_08350 [Neptunitalea chrysea]|uniref:Uncharacterized protein n=1 Tax=Neptunitalea chrysea TaxID=1647581 RepID=A0A9W6B3A2_9FLAO|nr:hypothetical protein [Neptunitalea chrysea]GLB51796.1 hypothetical protein NBRC110019_08350 [Neptunitalea chrysea]